MDLAKSVSKYLNSPIKPSLLTRFLTRSSRLSNSSTPTPNPDFIQFWDKADSTGITKIRELLCGKHHLQAYKSHDGKIYAFICADCDTAFYVKRNLFKAAWTREDPVLREFRAHWYEEEKEAEVAHFYGPRNFGVLGIDN